LCVPDPVFGHTETHVLQAPDGVPVQRLLLSSLSGQGLSSAGGLQFEVWFRYYYPNVRDQLVAKSILPLSKLCALVTMQRQHPSEAEMFSLPLFPRADSTTGHQSKPSGTHKHTHPQSNVYSNILQLNLKVIYIYLMWCFLGLLDVCIRYKHRLMGPGGQTGDGASCFVTLVVQVHRASGLQAAARAWLPVHCLLLPGHSQLQRSTYCYLRYKFYDNDAFCSHMRHPSFGEIEEEGLLTVTFQQSRTIELRCSQPLMWYLREEKLEVQVWAAFSKDKTQRPRDTDRLVGSAFVDLSSFAKTSKQKLTISGKMCNTCSVFSCTRDSNSRFFGVAGVFPLFRRSAADLQGASLRVHITLATGSVPVKNLADEMDSDNQEELLLEESEEAAQDPLSSKFNRSVPDTAAVQHTETDLEKSFPASVVVDRAMHLSLKGCPLAERSESSPCCCVSYVTADSSEAVSTAVVASTECPVWDHQHQCRLSKELLVDSQQSLVFKVWHKGGGTSGLDDCRKITCFLHICFISVEMERVLGFASVDLSPLLWGFQSVCGWYNITDFNGQCRGQLKVSITPLKCVQALRGQRKPENEENTKKSSAFSLSYHTTATYSTFPSHITKYPEQMISSPDHTRIFLSDRFVVIFRKSHSSRKCYFLLKLHIRSLFHPV
ncbi:unnamed protein product, partial [Tetraodon nigroviridis]